MLTCQSCGTENPPGHRFCGSCGSALSAVCPACATPAPAGSRFCGSCGAGLGSPSAPASAPAPAVSSTERRVCSVLFADLVGFTPLSEARDAEEVRELLSRYFETARTIIARYGGVVEKFIGDAVMAVWGTPVATEGDAERAVRAGLDLVAAVTAFGADVGARGLALRAGVVTGEVAASIGAVGEGMVAGDAVNTAARVQSAATPGTVWVDDTTHRLAAAGIGFTDTGEHPLKGKAGTVHLWQATRVLSSVGGAQRVDGLEAPMLGRDVEERTLRDLFHACVDRRAPRLVTVTGAAGSGKTRLGWEFEKYIDGLADANWWHRGRCLSYGDGVAFWALAEAMRQRFDIADEDPVDVATRKFLERLADLVPDEQQRRFVGVRLGRLLGVTDPADTGAPLTREELFEGWRQFLEILATSEPVLLLIEDAHHADAGLLDFLVHVVEWTRQAPIFLIVFGRSELVDRRPDLAGGRNRTALSLDALEERSMRALVRALVRDVPEDAVAKIVDQAQGNPLFAVETVRSLIDRDVIVPVDGEYRMVGDLGTLSVPDSLQGLLAARLDALEPQLRSLAADAAVIGSTFPAEALTAVSGRPAAEVVAGLGELVRRDILDVTADPLSPQRGTYVFSQGLLRQVAYDTLSRRDRRTRHLAVAEHLQRTFADGGEEVMDVVAQHYLDALGAGDDDPGIRERAVSGLVRAGERSGRSGAHERAGQSFVRAAGLVEETDPGGAASLLERAQDEYGQAARYERSLEAGDRARELHLARGDRRSAARVRARNGRWLQRIRRHDESHALLEDALGELRRSPDHDTVAALTALVAVHTFTGELDQARAVADEALGLAQALEADDERISDLFGALGVANLFARRATEAVVQLRYAAELGRQLGDAGQEVRALNNLANAYLATDPVAAVEVARQAVSLCRLGGNRSLLGTALSTVVEALLITGGWDEATAELTSLAEADADNIADEDSAMVLAVVLARRGERDAAVTLAELPGMRVSTDVQDVAYVLWADAELAAADRDSTAVVALAQRLYTADLAVDLISTPTTAVFPLGVRAAFELGRVDDARTLVAYLDGQQPGHLSSVLRADLGLARARLMAHDGGPADTVDAAFRDAIEQLRASGAPYHLAHGLLDLAEHEAARGRDAGALREEASAIGERLGAAEIRRRLQQAGVGISA